MVRPFAEYRAAKRAALDAGRRDKQTQAESQSVQPDNYGTALTFFAYTGLILGGAARVMAPIAGAVIFWFLLVFVEQMLRQAVSAGYVPEWLIGVNQVGQIRLMLVGLGLMLLMIFRPQGIFGDRKELALDARA